MILWGRGPPVAQIPVFALLRDRGAADEALAQGTRRRDRAKARRSRGGGRGKRLARARALVASPVMQKLSSKDRLRLMKFVCSFVWADLEVKESERKFVEKMVKKLRLDDAEAAQVKGWLEVPPPAEEVDPTRIPKEHRQIFLDTIRDVITADGEVASSEWENLALFEQLLGNR
jgi:uncharacterized tellurite resistance protein B-like protein